MWFLLFPKELKLSFHHHPRLHFLMLEYCFSRWRKTTFSSFDYLSSFSFYCFFFLPKTWCWDVQKPAAAGLMTKQSLKTCVFFFYVPTGIWKTAGTAWNMAVFQPEWNTFLSVPFFCQYGTSQPVQDEIDNFGQPMLCGCLLIITPLNHSHTRRSLLVVNFCV